MKRLQKAILSTLVYHDIFDYPLTEQEILKLLVQSTKSLKNNSEVTHHKNINKSGSCEVKENIKRLVSEKIIKYKNPYYFLKNREQIVNLRKGRKKYSKEKIKVAKKIVKVFQFIPWIKMIGISGALAMNNSYKDDDIDFLIITSENRLWLTRLLLIVILEILRKRRRPKDKIFKDKICLNLFLDEESLSLEKRNLFIAHEIVQMKMIFNRDNTYERFLQVNKWVEEYLPNGIKVQSAKCKVQNYSSKFKVQKTPIYYLSRRYAEDPRFFTSGLFTQLLNILERISYQFQLKYMKSKQTMEQISPHFAFFHPQNRSKEILAAFKDKSDRFLKI